MTDHRLLASDEEAFRYRAETWNEASRQAARTTPSNNAPTSFPKLRLPLELVDPVAGVSFRLRADTSLDPDGQLVTERKEAGVWIEIERIP